MLTGTLKSLFAVAEAYPDLKANQNFMMLQEELSGTESKIAYARQFYNDSVMSLNTAHPDVPDQRARGHVRLLAARLLRDRSSRQGGAEGVRSSAHAVYDQIASNKFRSAALIVVFVLLVAPHRLGVRPGDRTGATCGLCSRSWWRS